MQFIHVWIILFYRGITYINCHSYKNTFLLYLDSNFNFCNVQHFQADL